MAASAIANSGVVDPSKLYTLQGLSQATGMGETALRRARREGGLEMIRVGMRTFVKGSAFIAYAEANGKVIGPKGELFGLGAEQDADATT